MRGRKEGNVLFNDALNTFYLWLYGVRQVVKEVSDNERKPATATWVSQTAQVITGVCVRRKEGNVLFNDDLNTFYLCLYDIGHMVKDLSDSERKPATTT